MIVNAYLLFRSLMAAGKKEFFSLVVLDVTPLYLWPEGRSVRSLRMEAAFLWTLSKCMCFSRSNRLRTTEYSWSVFFSYFISYFWGAMKQFSPKKEESSPTRNVLITRFLVGRGTVTYTGSVALFLCSGSFNQCFRRPGVLLIVTLTLLV